MAWLHSTHSLIYAQVTTGEALHPLTVERLATQLLGNDASAPLPLPDYTDYVRGVFEKLEAGGWNESSRPSVAPVRGAGFKVLYPQLPKRGFGVDSQSALKGFLKYAAASRVKAWCSEGEGRRLLSLINNAGVLSPGFIEMLTLSDFERDASVNYLGVVRVCKAFLPLLKQTAAAAAGEATRPPPPRVVIVSSMSGKLPVPILSAYACSKHAVAPIGVEMW